MDVIYMARKLSLSDFRAVRYKLEPHEFVFSEVDTGKLVAHITTYPCYRVYGGTEMPRAPNVFVSLRRLFNPKGLSGRHSRDNPSCIALQKTAPDIRDQDWHVDF